MTQKSIKWLSLLGVFALGAGSLACAQSASQPTSTDSALIDVLVKKGIINDQEAQQLQAEVAQQETAPTLGVAVPGLKSLNLFGDSRVRYEYREGSGTAAHPGTTSGAGGSGQEIERYRYRVRLGLAGELKDGWFFGTRVAAGSNPRSTNVTVGSTGYASSTNNGPFSREASLAIDQAYIGKKADDFTFWAGRMPTTFVATDMLYDIGDLTPEGLAEQWSHTEGGMTYIANLGQYVYGSPQRTNSFGAGINYQSTYLFVVQAGARAKIGNGTLEVLPTYWGYSNGYKYSGGAWSNPNSGEIPTQGLSLIDIPVTYKFKANGLPFSVFGDFVINTDASARASDAGYAGQGSQNIGYQVGVGYGDPKVTGDFGAKVYWQSTDAFAIDPNLTNPDLFDGRSNMQGLVFKGTYVITTGLTADLTYGVASIKDKELPTYGAQNINASYLGHYQVVQVDLNLKF